MMVVVAFKPRKAHRRAVPVAARRLKLKRGVFKGRSATLIAIGRASMG